MNAPIVSSVAIQANPIQLSVLSILNHNVIPKEKLKKQSCKPWVWRHVNANAFAALIALITIAVTEANEPANGNYHQQR